MSVAVDFETFYDSEYSLRKMLPYLYVYDKRFDAYMVAVYGEGIEYVGHPKDFDWTLLAGKELLAHNAAFDGLVLHRLQQLNIVPAFPFSIRCTADMAAHLRAPRNLAGAVKWLLGRDRDKSMRAKMMGRTKEQIDQAGDGAGLIKYTLDDAKDCYELWEKCSHLWPEAERELSRLNIEAQWRGVPMNQKALDEARQSLDTQAHNLLKSIPWTDTDKPLSPKATRAEARKCGIPAPASFNKKDPACVEWMNKYAAQYPWVTAIRDYRSLTTMISRVKALIDGAEIDGWYHYTSLYQGAERSGRFSAGFRDSDDDEDSVSSVKGKFNMYNMPRKAMFGIDLRGMIAAPEGYKFVVADFAQIEARLVLWRAGETKFLEMLEREGNLYQAYAKFRGDYTGNALKKDDPHMYQHAKVKVLSAGYGCGAARYQAIAKSDYGLDLTYDEAKAAVDGYRSDFPLVPQYWNRHMEWLKVSTNHNDETHVVPLVSGRKLTYFNPRWAKDSHGKYNIVASTVREGDPEKLYGGLLTGHEIQGTARDVMRDSWIACARNDVLVLFTVYDELVALAPVDDAVRVRDTMQRLMRTSAPFVAGCPMDVEIHIVDKYFK